jgi:hypothetical protein
VETAVSWDAGFGTLGGGHPLQLLVMVYFEPEGFD